MTPSRDHETGICANLRELMETKTVNQSLTLSAATTPPTVVKSYRVESLNSSENKALALRMRAGDEQARSRMIEGNQLLVMREARRYLRCDLPLEDLVAEGTIGLIRAIDKFDTDQDYTLSTYAMSWIRYQIERFIMKNRSGVDVPESMLKQMGKVSKAHSRLAKFFGREPSYQELAHELDMPIEDVVAIISITDCTQSDWDPVREASIADSTAVDHDLVEQVESERMIEALGRAFDTLSEVDRDLIRGRYGLGSSDIVTLEELARRHRLSVRQVRSRVDKALEKLKQHFHPA